MIYCGNIGLAKEKLRKVGIDDIDIEVTNETDEFIKFLCGVVQ